MITTSLLLAITSIIGLCIGGMSSQSNNRMTTEQKQLACIEVGAGIHKHWRS